MRLLFYSALTLVVFSTSIALAQADRATFEWPDTQYKFEVFNQQGFTGLVVKGPVPGTGKFEALKLARGRPNVISATTDGFQLYAGQTSLGRDPKAAVQLGLFDDKIVIFTKHGLSFISNYPIHPTHHDFRVSFQGNYVLIQFKDSGNTNRTLLFVQNHVLEIADGVIDSQVRKFSIGNDKKLVVNDREIGSIADLKESPVTVFLGNQSREIIAVQASLKADSTTSAEVAQFLPDQDLKFSEAGRSGPALPKDQIKTANGSNDAQKLDQHWKESVEIAAAQGRKHISEVEAFAQQDGQTVRAFDVVKNFARDLDVVFHVGNYTLDPDERVLEDNMITVFHNKEVGNVKYLGPGGSGKSTSIQNLIYRRRDLDMIGDLRQYAILELNLSAMNSSKYKGSEGANLNALVALAEAYKKAGFGLIVVVDEAHTMKPSKSSDGGTDITQILKPQTANGTIRVLGISTRLEWDNAFIQDVAWDSRFALVEKQEPQGERLIKMLQGWAKRQSYPELTKDSADLIVQLSNRFDPVGAQPRRGIRLLDTVYSSLKVANHLQAPSKEDIFKVASSFYSVDRAEFSESERMSRIGRLNDELLNRVVGQDQAKEALMMAEMISVTSSGEANKPQHRILLSGLKGSGHTTLVKTLADVSKKKLTEVDVSQYSDPSGVNRLQQVIAKAARASSIGIIYLTNFEMATGPIQLLLRDIFSTGKMEVMMDQTIQEFNLRNLTFVASTSEGQEYLEGLKDVSEFSGLKLRESVAKSFYAPLLEEMEVVPMMKLKGDNLKTLVGKIVSETMLERSARENGRVIKISSGEASYIDSLVNRYGDKANGSEIRREVVLNISRAVAEAKLSAGAAAVLELEFKDAQLRSKSRLNFNQCKVSLDTNGTKP